MPLAVIFVGHLALGGNSQALSLYFSIGQALAASWAIGCTALPQLSPTERHRLVRVAVLAIALLAVMAISAGSWAISPWAAWLEILKLSALLLTAFAGFRISSAVQSLRPLLTLFTGLGCAYLTLTLTVHFLLPGTVFGAEKFSSEERYTATFISANATADLCVLLILVGVSDITARFIGLAQAHWSLKARLVFAQGWLSALTVGLAGLGLVLTESRAGITLGLVAILSQVIWEQRSAARRPEWKLGSLAPVVGLGLIGGLAMILALEGRADQALQSAQYRQIIWAEHWQAVVQKPWLGYGPGSFEALNRRLTNAENFDLFTTLGAMHNVYLQWLEQLGFLGSALMWALIGLAVWQIGLGARQTGARGSDLRLTVVLSCFILAHNVADYGLEIPSLAAQWSLFLGASFGLALRVTSRAMTRRPQPKRRPRRRTTSV